MTPFVYFFEGRDYPKSDIVNALSGNSYQKLCIAKDGEIWKFDCVGYCYDAKKGKSIFILPKVFDGIENQDDLLAVDEAGNYKNQQFLSQLSMWLYSAISKYDRDKPESRSVQKPPAQIAKFTKGKPSPALVEVKNSLESFYRENQSLFVFVAKNKHSGNNRINWTKTVSKNIPFLQKNLSSVGCVPIYINLVNKKNVFDLDDRLLVMYFSVMDFVQHMFGFPMPHSEYYETLKPNEVLRLMQGGRGLRELKKIKYKYFADKFIRLYNILYAFFEWGESFTASGNNKEEYLLVNKFNMVFEAMIDDLISDPLPVKLKHLKFQRDNKEVDHLYKYRSLVFADESQKIWFIGDSKYYGNNHAIDNASISKQYTYARNIVQYHIHDIFGSDMDLGNMRYRDELTEGYEVSPNFFIRGSVEKLGQSYDLSNDLLTHDEGDGKEKKFDITDDEGNVAKSKQDLWDVRNRHFENRLFDRDTLLLQVYSVNFLFVLRAYTMKGCVLRETFRSKARKLFRKNFLTLLNEKYYFWGVWPKDYENAEDKEACLEKFVKDHFKVLVGKIFRPNKNKTIVLALERTCVENCKPDNEDDEFMKLRKEIENDCRVINISPALLWDDAIAKGQTGFEISGKDSVNI